MRAGAGNVLVGIARSAGIAAIDVSCVSSRVRSNPDFAGRAISNVVLAYSSVTRAALLLLPTLPSTRLER